jgi:hypothetical protein
MMFLSRHRAATGGVLAAMLISTGLVAVTTGPAQAAALPAQPPCADRWVSDPQRTGFLNPKVTVRGSVTCDVAAHLMIVRVTVMRISGGGQTTREYLGRQVSSLSGSVSQTCVSGWYRGKAYIGVDGPGFAFDETRYSQDVYIDCA